MVQENYTIKREKGKHLTTVERGRIEAYHREGFSARIIAEKIGVSTRTIQRELKRGWVKNLLNSDLSTYEAYSAQKAENRYHEKQANKQGNLKIGKNHELIKYLENMILIERKSPYAALESAKANGYIVNICEKTLYNYIHSNLFLKLTSKDLPYRKKYKKYAPRTKEIRKKKGRSIDERSEVINNREEVGHFEIDTVIGVRESSPCLLVLTDRKTRFEIVRLIKGKKSEYVIEELKKIAKKYKGMIKTLTSDNGSEFMTMSTVEEWGIEHFYAHSFCSFERGSNENNNKLIRRFFPKGTDFKKLTKKQIKKLEKWINQYQRKLFEGKTAEYMFLKEYSGYKN